MDYYGRLQKLWDGNNDFDALPSCKCSGRKCALNEEYRKQREIKQAREFLMGLELCYANVRSSILGIEPLPSLHNIYSRLVQEEEVRLLIQQRPEASAPMTFALRNNSSRPILRCTHCRKNGHLEDRCWEKHGYPEGRKPRHSGAGRGNDMAGSSNNAPSVKTNVTFGEVPTTANNVRLHSKDIRSWITDTGASTRVCCDESLFDSCHSISPIPVGLPNGTSL